MLSERQDTRPNRRYARRKNGLSLAEVVVVLAVLGVAAATVGRIGVGQQTHYRDFAARMQTRSTLREGSAVLAAELRGVSPLAGDLYPGEMRDASVAFRSTIGTFALCEAAIAGASAIDVTDLDAGADSTIGGDTGDTAPSPGDSLWLYDSGAEMDGADDRWLRFVVTAVTRLVRPCDPDAAAAERDVFRLALAPTVQAATEPHAPVRLFRRARYALYESSDGLWYLGFSDCRPIVRNPPCAALQPISGPYEPYRPPDSGAPSGLTLTWLDRDGTPTTDPLAVARIGIVLRARASGAGRREWQAADSQIIALRNAIR